MMKPIKCSVDIDPALKKVLDKGDLEREISAAIAKTTRKTKSYCEEESPVRTGNLRDSHSVEIESEEGRVCNSAEYCEYVVYGTYKMKANNYPMRAVNRITREGEVSKNFIVELKEDGLCTR